MRAGLGAAALAALVLAMTAAEVDAAPALDPVVEAQNFCEDAGAPDDLRLAVAAGCC